MWEDDIKRSFAITMFNIAYLGGFTLGPVSYIGLESECKLTANRYLVVLCLWVCTGDGMFLVRSN